MSKPLPLIEQVATALVTVERAEQGLPPIRFDLLTEEAQATYRTRALAAIAAMTSRTGPASGLTEIAHRMLANRGRFPSGGPVPYDVVADLLAQTLDGIGADELTAENQRLEFALAYLTSCTAATAQQLAERKSASKREKDRFYSILGNMIDVLEGRDLQRNFSSSSIAGCLERAKRARNALDDKMDL